MELLSATLNDGVMPRSEIEGRDNSSEDKSSYKVVCKEGMVYNSMRTQQGANGISDYDGIVSPTYTVLMSNKEIDNRYFISLFKTPNLINEFRRYSQGLTSDTWNLKYPQIRSIRLYTPSLQEQHKISVFISTFEERTGIQRQLVDSLKKRKRDVITYTFSGKCNKFAAEATWIEETLADLCCEFRSGRNISASLTTETGEYAVYGGSGIQGYCDHYSHEGEYVVVGRQGALRGDARLIQGKNYLSEHATAVQANDENNIKLLPLLLHFMKLGQYSDQRIQPGLVVNKLSKLKCTVPDRKVQSKIASFLLNIDLQISNHEKMFSFLIDQRKVFLQQLFI